MTGWDELRYVPFAGDDSSDDMLAETEEMQAMLDKIDVETPGDADGLHSSDNKEDNRSDTKETDGLGEAEKSIEELKKDLTSLF